MQVTKNFKSANYLVDIVLVFASNVELEKISRRKTALFYFYIEVLGLRSHSYWGKITEILKLMSSLNYGNDKINCLEDRYCEG